MTHLISPLTAANLCKSSYFNWREPEGPVEALEASGYEVLFSLQKDLELETKGWFMVSKGKDPFMLGVFPGSDSLRDWVLNFKAQFVFWDVHDENKGFYAEGAHLDHRQTWFEVWKALRVCRAIQRSTIQLGLLGHSRGAQEAECVAMSLAEIPGDYHLDIRQVERFAPPRTGDKAFCEHQRSLIGHVDTAWVNADDVVPHLPTWRMAYRHATEPQWLRDHGRQETTYFHHDEAWPKRWEDVSDLSIDDHSIDSYIAAMRRLGIS